MCEKVSGKLNQYVYKVYKEYKSYLYHKIQDHV